MLIFMQIGGVGFKRNLPYFVAVPQNKIDLHFQNFVSLLTSRQNIHVDKVNVSITCGCCMVSNNVIT